MSDNERAADGRAGREERLTAREREVLALVADGFTTAEIGSALGLSSSTVRAHVAHMRNRLGAPTRAALVARAMRAGLLT